VTQATISRDIRELKITKVSVGGGKQRYAIVGESRDRFTEKFLGVYREAVIRIDHSQGGVVVLQTLDGMALAASRCIDAIGLSEILGTIAGVDTVACFTRDEEDAVAVVSKLKAVVRGEEAY
jgi:transcriptional regulator of arginine metabolism